MATDILTGMATMPKLITPFQNALGILFYLRIFLLYLNSNLHHLFHYFAVLVGYLTTKSPVMMVGWMSHLKKYVPGVDGAVNV